MPQELPWYYYNHAMIPTASPHETVDESPLQRKTVWKAVGGFPLFARWTTDFDCKTPTQWWYIIKDSPFLLTDVKANYRYKINKGRKHFEVQVIEPTQHAEAIYQVQAEAYAAYPAKSHPIADYQHFAEGLHRWQKDVTFAAFSKADGTMAGYIHVELRKGCVLLSAQKTKPSQEKLQVNAALVYGLLANYRQELAEGQYIADGERSILHETNFQEYLETYFGFRKAYCRLHILYRPGVRQLVAFLYPIRGIFKSAKGSQLFGRIRSVLQMEEIVRADSASGAAKER
ncbi:MAG: hypothetical protein IH607_08780 [Firmicutes bacterium]|nr:hypothetical protein [Bacillota bacterium]